MDHFPVITGQLSGFGADIYLETMDRCPITHRIHFHERIARYFWPGDSGWQYTNMWKYKRIFSDCIPGNGRTSKYFRKVIHWKPIQIYLEVAGQSGYSWKVIRIFFYSVDRVCLFMPPCVFLYFVVITNLNIHSYPNQKLNIPII